MCTICLPKVKKTEKDANYCSLLGNQQNWFAKYINKKAYSTFSQPIGKICDDVTFSRKTTHAKLQNLMSSTFMYFFTTAQDFCARKGNKISLSYYWKYQYLVQKCWYAVETLLQSLPRVTPSPPLALIHMIFSRRIIKRYYYKNCVTRPTTDREVSSANMPGISTSFSSDSGLSLSRISSGWQLDLFGFEVGNGFNGTPLPFAINVQEKKCWPKILLLMYRTYKLFKEKVKTIGFFGGLFCRLY